MTRRRTWWHLESLGRRPNDYDIATSRLLWYPERGFAVRTPVADWVRVHQRERAFVCRDWDAFRDPRETTYAKYTELQRNREIFVDGLFAVAEAGDDDRRLAPPWLALLGRVMAPLRFPVHGLQMATAYVGAMAPGGRVVIACLLQAGDEVRRVQRLAYRLRMLQSAHPSLGTDSRAVWERDALWQPMRELVERLLVAYDWDEAIVALGAVVKPAFDELFMVRFAALARDAGDIVLEKLCRSLAEDCRWHHEWCRVLLDMLAAEDPANADRIAVHRETWRPRVERAVAPFAELFATWSGARP